MNATGLAVYLDFSQAIRDFGRDEIAARYGNLFDMYEEITDESPYETPMQIFPAIHYTMGGIWVDYELMTTVNGLFAIGECNFSDHGANRLGASALMQGLADGYFVLPYTIQNYLADQITVPRFSTELPEFEAAEQHVRQRIDRLFAINGKRSVDSIHKELGHIMWEYAVWVAPREGLEKALTLFKELRKTFFTDLFIPGTPEGVNVELEKALRLEDFILMGELVANDALTARNRAAVTSAKSTKPKKAKQSATMKTSSTWAAGNTKATTTKHPSSPKNPSSTKSSRCKRVIISRN